MADRTKVGEVHVVGAAILKDSRCLVAQRGPGMKLAGKWEFPGGKVEPDEDPRSALAREIEEELGVVIVVDELLDSSRTTVSGTESGEVELVLDVYAARIARGEIELREHSSVRWLAAHELADLDWAPADVPVLGAVLQRLES